MSTSAPSRTWHTVPQLAEDLGIAEGKVLSWIRSGQLTAVNVAASTSGRPRWRVSREALDQFLASRQVQPRVAVPRRRRRTQNITEFF